MKCYSAWGEKRNMQQQTRHISNAQVQKERNDSFQQKNHQRGRKEMCINTQDARTTFRPGRHAMLLSDEKLLRTKHSRTEARNDTIPPKKDTHNSIAKTRTYGESMRGDTTPAEVTYNNGRYARENLQNKARTVAARHRHTFIMSSQGCGRHCGERLAYRHKSTMRA